MAPRREAESRINAAVARLWLAEIWREKRQRNIEEKLKAKWPMKNGWREIEKRENMGLEKLGESWRRREEKSAMAKCGRKPRQKTVKAKRRNIINASMKL